MHTADIYFKLKPGTPRPPADGAISSFLVALLNGGNVVERPQIAMATVREGYRATVGLPERAALASVWHNAGIRAAKLDLAEAGVKLGPVRIIGEDPDSQSLCTCRRPPALILIRGDTPLTCGECGGKMPVYRMPGMRRLGHDHGLRSWDHRYRALDALWTGSDVGERFAYRQLSGLQSDVSKLGRRICRSIEKTAGIPTYYYLYRWYGRSVAAERRRTCPGCGRKWLADESERLFWCCEFRCDRCRLVSEIAHDVRRGRHLCRASAIGGSSMQPPCCTQ